MAIDDLERYLEDVRNTQFKWGLHDCLTFSNNAFHAMYGEGWCDDWVGRYHNERKVPLTNEQLKTEYGFLTLADAISSKLTPIDYIAPKGALVTAAVSRRFLYGHALGISNGSKAVFIMNKGLYFLPLDKVSGAWIR